MNGALAPNRNDVCSALMFRASWVQPAEDLATDSLIIRRHLLPSFTSYIIVDLMISFPYMVRSETALSFIGLGLKDPVNSLGALMQNVSKADVLLNYQWYFIPVIFFPSVSATRVTSIDPGETRVSSSLSGNEPGITKR